MLTRILLVLLICIAALYLAQMLWQLFSSYADLILLFVLGWLVSFILNPLVEWLNRKPIPSALYPTLESVLGKARTQTLAAFRFSRTAAVIIVYVFVLIGIVLGIALLIPPIVIQLSELASHLPEYTKEVPRASSWLQNELANWGIRLNLTQAIQTVLGNLQTYTADAIKNALAILTSLVSFFANLLLVLIISFIITLDGPKIRRAIQKNLLPRQYHEEFQFFIENVDRTFGGFLRGQIVQALLVGVGTGVAMTLFALNFVLIASLLAGLFMLIPLVGTFLALIPPLFVCLIQAPGLALWLFLVLLVYQLVIVNVVMPRVLSEAVGLHPLLIFAALLIGVRVAGFWGAFFGIPIAGVLWTMAVFFFQRWQARQSSDA
ncbi:MAG: AI-2E family transporter [Anaerolineae bacterium]|nr:AI-2E family transporter [Anaerolineae bacterium]